MNEGEELYGYHRKTHSCSRYYPRGGSTYCRGKLLSQSLSRFLITCPILGTDPLLLLLELRATFLWRHFRLQPILSHGRIQVR